MKFGETRETYAKIATLYYLGELSQDEIAEMFGISRFKVSRVLRRSKELGIIEFHINNKPDYYKGLEKQLVKALGIKRCLVVSPGSTAADSKSNVGKAAAKYLIQRLKDGMMVGFDWGTTLQTMVREFAPEHKYPGCMFVQISGSIASQSILDNGYMDGHDIVANLAAKAGANWSLFPAPYIVKEKMLRDMLLEEKTIKNHIQYFDQLDMVFFGVGSCNPEIYLPFYRNYLSSQECKQLEQERRTGELFSCQLDTDGNKMESMLSGRVLTIELDQLKSIPDVVVLAAGADKTQSLLVGARGGYFNTMIVTEIAALDLLEQLGQG